MTSTDIVKWRKNEWLWKFWKRNDLYEHFEKGGGGSREKGGGGNEIHAPCACAKIRETLVMDDFNTKKGWKKPGPFSFGFEAHPQHLFTVTDTQHHGNCSKKCNYLHFPYLYNNYIFCYFFYFHFIIWFQVTVCVQIYLALLSLLNLSSTYRYIYHGIIIFNGLTTGAWTNYLYDK